MPLVRCSGCSERPSDKPVQVNWAWRNADGSRKAYRMRLCASCFMAKVSPLSATIEADARLSCPNCGIDTEDDYDAVWTTNFIPGYGELRTESPFCNSCAAHVRIWVQEHGWELEGESRGYNQPLAHASPDEILRSLGIEPRA